MTPARNWVDVEVVWDVAGVEFGRLGVISRRPDARTNDVELAGATSIPDSGAAASMRPSWATCGTDLRTPPERLHIVVEQLGLPVPPNENLTDSD